MSFQKQAVNVFHSMSQMLELLGGDRFRVNAHAKASRVIKDLTIDIESLSREGDLKALVALDGIGKGTAGKLVELAQNGKIEEFEELSNRIPGGLMEVLKIQGLGPKTVKLMWDEKDVESIDGLKKIIEDGSILELPRMGAKTVENIKASIEFLETSGGRMHIGIAQQVADRFVEMFDAMESTKQVAFAGSLRRGQESIGDIDILIVSDDPEQSKDAFVNAEGVQQVLARGETKCAVRSSVGPDISRWGQEEGAAVQVDLRIVPEESWGAALMYFTGSKEHNVKLRERAISMGMTLNEYGLFKSGEDTSDSLNAIASRTEREIYEALDMPWIPPTLREDRGEFTIKEVPNLVLPTHIQSELHSHTIASDGKMTIEESAEIAKLRGFHTLAVTDHSQSSAVAGGLKPARLREHMKDIREVNDRIDGITILAGSEVDILIDGSLDYEDDLLHELDVVVASPHAGLRAKPAQATKRLIKAIEHPMVHVLGHPTGRLIEKRAGLEPDMNEIIAAAIEHNVALEINSHWMRLDLRDTHVRAAVEAGALISINCDDHHARDYENIKFGVMTAQRGWLTVDQCVNAWDHEKLHAWLKSKR